MKVIQISTSSSSFLIGDYKADLFRNWNAQEALMLKKKYRSLKIECWAQERKFKQEHKQTSGNVRFRIFPTVLSLRHGMDISFDMIKAMLEEIKIAKIKNEKIIFHFHEYHSWQVYLMLLFARKSKNVKILCQHHGARNPLSNLVKYPRLALFLPAIILTQFMENLLYKKVDIFYVLSKSEEDYLKNITKKSKIIFSTMGIAKEYFSSSSRASARKSLGLGNNEIIGLFLGRIKTTKGVKVLLDALLKIKIDNLKILFVGDGNDYTKYKNYAKENKINNVIFYGPAYGAKKMEFLEASNFLILPSFTEGAPVVIMEAIAKNLPVIATNVGGITKMIKNNREGLIIKPHSEKDIIKAIVEIVKWKKGVKKYALKYNWDSILGKTIQDYHGLF